MHIDTPQKASLNHPANLPAGPSRERVWLMFDRIAGKYDLLNHLLSFGFDLYWRKGMSGFLPPGTELALLDLATGTGDQIISVMKRSDRVKQAVAIDMSPQMLAIAGKKISRYRWRSKVKMQTGEGSKLEFPDDTFDVVTISFGIRNFMDLQHSLAEIRRVLKPAGRLLILEFSLPQNLIMRRLHLFYLRKILPVIGRIISGDDYAYRYLNETIETFPYGESFCSILSNSGFSRVKSLPLTCGIVTIYQGEK
jgi:demethylmenaquinone methyltransferase/2-methoxy-6-polyprenyl-1,4-benzoquinol methylase